MENLAPTKANLINVKASLEFSKKGFELLDKKRNVLVIELLSFMDRAKKLQEIMGVVFSEAYIALQKAKITMGQLDIENAAEQISEIADIEISFKSVMGVAVPSIKYEKKEITPAYSFYSSNSAVDIAYEKFNEVKYLIYELAEVENSIYKLATEVKKTQRRANALENLQIPKYIDIVKEISTVLEEKEREDFFRLKMVKKKKRSH